MAWFDGKLCPCSVETVGPAGREGSIIVIVWQGEQVASGGGEDHVAQSLKDLPPTSCPPPILQLEVASLWQHWHAVHMLGMSGFDVAVLL